VAKAAARVMRQALAGMLWSKQFYHFMPDKWEYPWYAAWDLAFMLDESEFLSPFGIRALSRYHLDHPFVFLVQGEEFQVDYLPVESNTGMFGGNSNWRGPVWMPVNVLIIKARLQFYLYYGDNFKIECPTGSGQFMNLFEVAREIGNRLGRIFLRNEQGRRPVYAARKNSRPTPSVRTISCSMNISTGTTAPAWELPTKPAGRASWPRSSSCSPPWTRRDSWSAAKAGGCCSVRNRS
jgi:hypothetical protein